MLLTDITKEIKSLPRFEKLQLIETISKMLLEEEDPARYVTTEAIYPIFIAEQPGKSSNATTTIFTPRAFMSSLTSFFRQAIVV